MEPPTTYTAGMNPERASMLQSIAAGGRDEWLESGVDEKPRTGPLVSGANTAGVAVRQFSLVQDEYDADAQMVWKRDSRSNEADKRNGWLCCRGASDLLQEPPINCDTSYLHGLLHYRTLRLFWEPAPKLKNSTPLQSHICHISDSGLVMNDLVRRYSKVPVLDLSLSSGAASLGSNGVIEKTVRGVLLEHVWHTMSPMSKQNMANQLAKLVKQMRNIRQETQTNGGKMRLGSVFSGDYSLLLDRHSHTTYWTIRSRPSQRQFVAFLLSSFPYSVPSAVAESIASQFKREAPLVFCHGEVSPRNIVVQNNLIVRILGWDCAGWYPEWWDYVKFFEARTSTQNQDWYEYSKYIFETKFNDELAAFQAVVRCQVP
ncbi:hypothetical protein CDD81_399 [Ophiocordyceps australis]|uniref:Aminoglycoside phosphotransferase domain-containing protein n=1 Tax=Ophiocordyceps australis TaxID=1399860 RepID=A0A2C5XG63_9HYPO|nr:hypothetical protein CDD81_399 [Ophiocordyceps australis]